MNRISDGEVLIHTNRIKQKPSKKVERIEMHKKKCYTHLVNHVRASVAINLVSVFFSIRIIFCRIAFFSLSFACRDVSF